MLRAAAEIDPVSRMLSSKAILPGPMRAPDSKKIESLISAMLVIAADYGRCEPSFLAIGFGARC
jgi:hypothetical protein